MNINNSPDISILDFTALMDISGATPSIVLTNQSVGNNLAGCTWWYVIKTPSFYAMHEGSETNPDVTNSNWATITVPDVWPQPFGQIEFSGNPYSIELFVKDSDDNIFSVKKEQRICKPVGNTQNIGNYGKASVSMNVNCPTAKMYVQDNTSYSFTGNSGVMVSKQFIVDYPLDATGTRPARFTLNNFVNALVPVPYSSTGYTLFLNSVYSYPFENGITVKVKYLLQQEFAVQCGVDLCPLICDFERLIADVQAGSCNGDYHQKKELLAIITPKMYLAMLAVQQPACGVDLPALIEDIKKIGGFDCNCMVGAGNNGQINNTTGLNFSVTGQCGDITGQFVPNGDNIELQLADVKYIFKICDGAPTDAFTITPSTSAGCVKTYCLNVDLDKLKDDLGITGTGNICVNVYEHGITPDTAPAACPNSFYPAYIYDITNSNIIGYANNATDTLAILNGDAGWSAKGVAINAGNCKVCFVPATGIIAIPALYVKPDTGTPPSPTTYTVNVKDYCQTGQDKPLNSFPQNMFVAYNTNARRYYLGNIVDYNDLLVKLAAESNKPANISYTAISNTDPLKIQVQVNDNTSSGHPVYIYGDKTDLVLIGGNSHYGTPNAGTDDVQLLYPDSNSTIGNICGTSYPGTGLHQNVFHVMKKGNRMYVLNSLGGLVGYDITDPLNPVTLGGCVMFGLAVIGSSVPFSGIPDYSPGKRSDWDVYFPTDINAQTQGDYLYVVESTSGTIYKIDPGSFTVVSAFYSPNLLGMCPRVIYKNKLYLTKDGKHGDMTGVSASNPNQPNYLVILDLNTFGITGFSSVLIDPAAANAGEVWAMSIDPKKPGTAYVTSLLGNVFSYDMDADAVVTAYNGVVTDVNFPNSELINTFVGADRLYISGYGSGSYQLAINTFGSASANAFQVLPAIGGTNKNHFNFQVLPNSCFGILTFDNGSNDAGIARFDLDGNYLFMQTFPGSIYNVVYQSGITSPTPNSLCP